MPLLMLWAPLKLGVSNPAGASVGVCASTLANPVAKALDVAAKQKQTRTLFERGITMSIPPHKTPITCARADASCLAR
jgi:hypothetical protein